MMQVDSNQNDSISKNREHSTHENFHLNYVTHYGNSAFLASSIWKKHVVCPNCNKNNLQFLNQIGQSITDKHILLRNNSILNVNFPFIFFPSHRLTKFKILNMDSWNQLGKNFTKNRASFFRSASLTIICFLILFVYLPVASGASLQKKKFISSLSNSIENNSSSIRSKNSDWTDMKLSNPTNDGAFSLGQSPSTVRTKRFQVKQKKANNRRRRRRKGKKRKRKNRKNSVNRRKKTAKEKKRKSGKGNSRRIYFPQNSYSKNPLNHRQAFSSPRLQRLYNKAGSSFHLAVWKNGNVGGEASNKRSNFSKLQYLLFDCNMLYSACLST